LERDHGYLAGLLRPGLSVLDVGCASGAITVGIAEAVGPDGTVLGVDRDPKYLEQARSAHGAHANLQFEIGEATSLSYHARFDIVTAARLLQWIANPALAVAGMKAAAKPNGMVVVHDFNHLKHEWKPDPPPEFRYFYQAFLAWRQANQWDNEMADRLPALFRSAGLLDVESHVQDEIIERGDPDFFGRAALWSDAIDGLGDHIVKAGLLTGAQVKEAGASYSAWTRTGLVKQVLQMRTVTGTVPA
jgi:SAM-dependent methyltransferase